MEINELISMLTDGLDPDSAAKVRAAVERDAVKSKVSTLKQQSEYDTLQTRAATLQQELEDQGQPGQQGYKAGARSYQKWYEQNYTKIQKLQADIEKYQEKYGTLDAPTATPTATGGKTFTEEQIQAMVDARIQGQYAPRWSDLLTSTGSLVQKHMFAGRKTPIDFTAVANLAKERFNGDLNLAYDEWDKPEREKVETASREAEIKRRVDEEIAKRGASGHFPAAADFTPGALSARTKDSIDKFDPNALKADLAAEWNKSAA